MSEPQVLEPTDLEPVPTELEPVPTELKSDTTQRPPADEVLGDDLLVEEISIDGMCGVY